MSIMFRNSNESLEKELAAEDYKAHPVRNRLAVLAVALSAILLGLTLRWESVLYRLLPVRWGLRRDTGARALRFMEIRRFLKR